MPDAPPADDLARAALLDDVPNPETTQPARVRRSRSGTSGAERRRQAKAAAAAAGEPPPSTRSTTRRDRAPKPPSAKATERQITDVLGLVSSLPFLSPRDAALLRHNGPRLAAALCRYPALARMVASLAKLGDESGGILLIAVVLLSLEPVQRMLPAQFRAYSTMAAGFLGAAPPDELVRAIETERAEAGAALAAALAAMQADSEAIADALHDARAA
jgi:hypothetical protein